MYNEKGLERFSLVALVVTIISCLRIGLAIIATYDAFYIFSCTSIILMSQSLYIATKFPRRGGSEDDNFSFVGETLPIIRRTFSNSKISLSYRLIDEYTMS